MNQGQLQQLITDHNVWWRRANWEADDPDLQEVAEAPFDYEPAPLTGIKPDGVYFLRGPRRVGKTVEVKRAIAHLIRDQAVNRRAIVHFACNGLTPGDVKSIALAAQRLLDRVPAPHYFLLDEITAAKPGWQDSIAFLRDNNPLFRQACVVLTGSSSRGLDVAIKALADRRGRRTLGDDRILLPMDFRAFCAEVQERSAFPEVGRLRPRNFTRSRLANALEPLLPHLGELVGLWDLYLQVGGFPRAVADWVRVGQISDEFVSGLWQVVHGEAIASERLSAVSVMALLAALARRICSPMNLTQLASDAGLGHHEIAKRRVEELTRAYLCWPCHQDRDGAPNPRAQEKRYFVDPLLARLAHLRDARFYQPTQEQVAEQQLGVALLRALDREEPGMFDEYSALTYLRSETGSEVDFVGTSLGNIGFESKYADKKDARAAQPLGTYRRNGVMVTRGFYDLSGNLNWLPAAFVAWLL